MNMNGKAHNWVIEVIGILLSCYLNCEVGFYITWSKKIDESYILISQSSSLEEYIYDFCTSLMS